MEQEHKRGFWYGFNIAALILIIFFILGLPLLQAFASFLQTVDLKATQAQPAEVYLPTAIAIEFTNIERTPLNAIEFELAYDPRALALIDILPNETLCEKRFMITNRIDNALGAALFQCGTITQFDKATGTIATVHVIPLRSGTSTISFAPKTHILAHDGLGTDATRQRIDLQFSAI